MVHLITEKSDLQPVCIIVVVLVYFKYYSNELRHISWRFLLPNLVAIYRDMIIKEQAERISPDHWVISPNQKRKSLSMYISLNITANV